MADFDAQQAHAQAQAHQDRFDQNQARMIHMEHTIAQMGNALHNLQNVPQPATTSILSQPEPIPSSTLFWLPPCPSLIQNEAYPFPGW